MINNKEYWQKRYEDCCKKKGYGSGYGSEKNELKFKIQFVEEFLYKNNIKTICDYGCGSGNFILGLKDTYNKYVAYDFSENAIDICRSRIENEKVFLTCNLEDCDPSIDLALSIDVLFHQINYEEFMLYLNNIFRHKFVIIYTTDYEAESTSKHVVRRRNSEIISKKFTNYSLITNVKNTENNDKKEFFVYEKN